MSMRWRTSSRGCWAVAMNDRTEVRFFALQEAIPPIPGFRVAGVHAGLKDAGARDVALLVADRPCVTAGVFTQNTMLGAPVLFNQQQLAQQARMRAIAVNTVSANAATGKKGLENAQRMAQITAEALACDPAEVLVMSTGVIGTHLPLEKIEPGIQQAASRLGEDWRAAADAIRTTDTRPKLAALNLLTTHGMYTIAGIAKGSGMIAPNMATMLGMLFTDAKLTPDMAQQSLQRATRQTFNRVVVDGDTSPNDMVTLMANGSSGVELHSEADRQQFEMALTQVARALARMIVKDGEGASKFITLQVSGAVDDHAAERIAHTIATSPLVKTAFYGADANWGRIIAAAGRAGVAFDPDQAELWFAPGEALAMDDKSDDKRDEGRADRGLRLFNKGMPSRYSEKKATDIVREDAIYVTLDCGQGDGEAIVWTCDLSHDYVSINADYRT